MRPITFHAINPCNEAIALSALDTPGPGGACHLYMARIDSEELVSDAGRIAYEAYCGSTGWKSAVSGAPLPPWEKQADAIKLAWNASAGALAKAFARNPCLAFQNGPVKEDGNGVNGLTHEILLAVLIDRVEGFQSGPWACPENALTLGYLRAALASLHARTHAREARGVEGTHKV